VVERYRLLDYEAAKEGLERDARENLRPATGADAGSAPDYNYRGKHLQLQFTVEDEGVFTMPWSATITYRRGAEAWREVVCAENRIDAHRKGHGGADGEPGRFLSPHPASRQLPRRLLRSEHRIWSGSGEGARWRPAAQAVVAGAQQRDEVAALGAWSSAFGANGSRP
jgi:hypothetical protein